MATQPLQGPKCWPSGATKGEESKVAPVLSWGPVCGQHGYTAPSNITPTVMGAHMWANWRHDPCRLQDSQKGGENQTDCITCAVLGACTRAKWLHNPCRLEGGGGNQSGSITCGDLGAQMRAKWLHNAYRLGGHHKGGGNQVGSITPAVLGGQLWAKVAT